MRTMQTIRPARWRPRVAALALCALCASAAGCRKASSPPHPTNQTSSAAPRTEPHSAIAPSAAAPASVSPTTSTNAPPASSPRSTPTLEAHLDSFSNAPPAVRDRIQQALATFRSGQPRQAITQLKLVDADSELTAEQQAAIKSMILQMRE